VAARIEGGEGDLKTLTASEFQCILFYAPDFDFFGKRWVRKIETEVGTRHVYQVIHVRAWRTSSGVLVFVQECTADNVAPCPRFAAFRGKTLEEAIQKVEGWLGHKLAEYETIDW